MTNEELKNILELSGSIVNVYSNLSGSYLATIAGDINKSYLFNIENIEINSILECENVNPINEFWYDEFSPDGNLVPCKVFNYGDTDEIPLNTLSAELTEFNLPEKNSEIDLSVYFNPADAEMVGKVDWTVSGELSSYIILTPARDTLSCNVKLTEDVETNIISGIIIATPYDNNHEYQLSGKIVFNCSIGKEIINKVKTAYIISDAIDARYNGVYYLYNEDEVEADSSVDPIYSTINGELSGNIIWRSNNTAGPEKIQWTLGTVTDYANKWAGFAYKHATKFDLSGKWYDPYSTDNPQPVLCTVKIFNGN